jgi:hypothetical protein
MKMGSLCSLPSKFGKTTCLFAVVLTASFWFLRAAIAQDNQVRFSVGPPAQGLFAYAGAVGPVTNAQKAISVARPILERIYGKEKIQHEEPLTGALAGDVWIVHGTLHCEQTWWQKLFAVIAFCLGGTAELRLSARTGAVLGVTHYM